MNQDQVTIEYVLAGKTDHFATLMNKYHNEIFSFIFNMLGNYDDTEDLLQEIFLRVYENLSKYDKEKSSFRTWLYRVASNYTLNYLKSSRYKKRVKQKVNIELLQDDTDIYEEAIKDQQIKLVIAAMKKLLSPKHQKILILHYFSGFTVKEISEVLEMPDKTIYKALHSSIEKIKKKVT